MAKKLKPVHPGEILREEFMTRWIKYEQDGHGTAGAGDANRGYRERAPRHHRRHGAALCALFKNSAAFWMNLQTRYDLEVAEDEIAARLRGMYNHWKRLRRERLARRTRLPTSNPYLLTFYFVASFRPYLLTSYSLLTFPQIFRITTTRNSFKPPHLPHPFSDHPVVRIAN